MWFLISGSDSTSYWNTKIRQWPTLQRASTPSISLHHFFACQPWLPNGLPESVWSERGQVRSSRNYVPWDGLSTLTDGNWWLSPQFSYLSHADLRLFSWCPSGNSLDNDIQFFSIFFLLPYLCFWGHLWHKPLVLESLSQELLVNGKCLNNHFFNSVSWILVI